MKFKKCVKIIDKKVFLAYTMNVDTPPHGVGVKRRIVW